MEGTVAYILLVAGVSLLVLSSVRALTLVWIQRMERRMARGDLEQARRYFELLLWWSPRRLEFTSMWNRAALDVRLVGPGPAERTIDFLIQLSDRAMRRQPRLIALRRLKAHLLRQQGKLSEAREQLEAVPRREHPVDSQQRGMFYELTGDLTRAAEEYRHALDRLENPRPSLRFTVPRARRSRMITHVLRSLAQVYSRLGRLEEAAETLTRVAEMDRDSLEGAYSRIALAGLLERLQGPAASEALLRRSTEEAPAFASLYLQTLGELQTRAGDHAGATASFEQALGRLMVESSVAHTELAENPRYLSLMLARVELDLSRGDFVAARDTLDRLREQAPTHPLVNLAWAGYYERQGEDATAVAYLERAVAAPVDGSSLLHELTRPAARARLAECYLRLGRRDDAEAEYRRALKTGDRHPHLLASLAYLAPDEALLKEAQTEFQARLARNPSDAELLTGLGVLRGKQGQLEEALELLERAVGHNPRDVAGWAALAEIQSRRQQPGKAAEAYRRALELALRPDQKSLFEARLKELET